MYSTHLYFMCNVVSYLHTAYILALKRLTINVDVMTEGEEQSHIITNAIVPFSYATMSRRRPGDPMDQSMEEQLDISKFTVRAIVVLT